MHGDVVAVAAAQEERGPGVLAAGGLGEEPVGEIAGAPPPPGALQGAEDEEEQGAVAHVHAGGQGAGRLFQVGQVMAE